MASRPKDHDRFESALKRELAKTQPPKLPDCPEPEILAAYYDAALPSAERTTVNSHLVECPRCQSMIAAIARADDVQSVQAPFSHRFRFWRVVPIAAALAGAIALIVVLKFRGEGNHPEQIALAPRQIAATAQAPPVEGAPSNSNPVAPRANETPANNAAVFSAAVPAPPAKMEERVTPATRESKQPTLEPQSRTHISGRASRVQPSPQEQEPETGQLVAKSSGPAAPIESPARPAPAIEAPTYLAPSVGTSRAPGAAAPVEHAEAPTTHRSEAGVFSGPMTGAVEQQSARRTFSGNTAVQSETGSQLNSVGAPGGSTYVEALSPSRTTAWAVGANGRILRWLAGGNWQSQPSGVAADLLAASAPNDSTCWVVGKSGTVLRTTDGGTHWISLVSPTKADVVAVTSDGQDSASILDAQGHRFVTHDGGLAWSAN